MSELTDFFLGGSGGGTAIGQLYLPGSLDTYPDIYTAEDGNVYLKTGASALASDYPLARPLKPIAYTANQIPGFTNPISSGATFIDLPGENKFLATINPSYTSNYWNYVIIDRANPPTTTAPNPSSSPQPQSSVDNRYYAPAVRDRVSGLRYTYSSTGRNGSSWYNNGMQTLPKIGQVTGSWPNYTSVGTHVTPNFTLPGVLPGGTLPNYTGLYESVYRPTVSGATSTKGFITYRATNASNQAYYLTFSIEDGSMKTELPTTTLTSGIGYTCIAQMDNGDIYLGSRYGNTPAFQKIDSNTLQYSEPQVDMVGNFWSANTVQRAADWRGSCIIQGSTPNSLASFINSTSNTTASQINEIYLDGLAVLPKRYAAQQTDASAALGLPHENQTLYWRIA